MYMHLRSTNALILEEYLSATCMISLISIYIPACRLVRVRRDNGSRSPKIENAKKKKKKVEYEQVQSKLPEL